MFSVNEPLKEYLEVDGRRVPLCLSFDRVLTVCDAWADDGLDENEKIAITFKLLVPKPRFRRWLARRSAETLEAAVTTLFKDYIDTGPHSARKGPRAFDLKQDAPFLYAAFRQIYGVDLFMEQGRLDWRTFSAMLAGLPAGTRLSEIIDIRTREIPKPDKYNAKERRALIEAKSFYRLRPEKPAESMQNKLADLFGELETWAKS